MFAQQQPRTKIDDKAGKKVMAKNRDLSLNRLKMYESS